MAKNNDTASVLAFEKNWCPQMAICMAQTGIPKIKLLHWYFRKNQCAVRFPTA